MTGAITLTFCTLAVYIVWRERHRRRDAVEMRLQLIVAMEFIAEDNAPLAHEFAAIFLAGNRQAMQEKFPDFEAWRIRRLLELTNSEDEI